MIQIGLALPLLAVGAAGAAWRHYRQRSHYARNPDVLALSVDNDSSEVQIEPKSSKSIAVFDDVGELDHYQKVSWYALALAASGSWFYPPVVLVSVPLLGYNAYHFYRTKRQSDPSDQKTPLSIFEIIGVVGTLATGRAFTASLIFLASFGGRKLLLQAGNITNNIGLSRPFNPRNARVWVLRDEAEIETTVSELEEDDIIILHQGDTVVVSGKVVKGEATIRQFSLRKHMKLLPKQAGDSVHMFTKIESGSLYIQPA